MTAKQLAMILSGLGDEEVVIKLSQPSIGPTACATIDGVGLGFDWDMGKVFLFPLKELIDKEPVR